MEGRYKNPKIDTGELTLKRRLENQIFVEGLSGTKFNGIRTYFENFGEVKKVTLAIIFIEDLVLSHLTTKKTPRRRQLCEFGSHEINGRY